MSIMGVPFNISKCLTNKILRFISSTSTIDRPIGFGLTGEQILKTPISLSPCGGILLKKLSVNF
jgi:hypothetical protein